MSEVQEIVEHMQSLRKEYLDWRTNLDLDGPKKYKIDKRRTKPKPKTLEELKNQAKYKKRWKGAGAQNSEFASVASLKPCVLSTWETAKAMAPERSFKAPPGSKPILVPQVGREFGQPSMDQVSKRFKTVLLTNIEKFNDYVQRPSQYQKPPPELTILHPRGFTPAGTLMKEFGFPTTHLLPKSMTMKK